MFLAKKILLTGVLLFVLLGTGCKQSNITKFVSTASTSPAYLFDSLSTSTTKTFSEPKADFTFQYPTTWKYQESTSSQKQYPSAHIWDFTYEGKPILRVSSPPYEAAFDGCYTPNDSEGNKNLVEFNIFETNDPHTTIASETCAPCVTLDSDTATSCPLGISAATTYIYWFPGVRLDKNSLEWNKPEKERQIIFGLSGSAWRDGGNGPTKEQYLNTVHRLVLGIKLKKS